MSSLKRRYPAGANVSVGIYEPQSDDDRSLGYAERNHIVLNGYWFSRRPIYLRLAAFQGRKSGDSSVAKWHGDMREPGHVLSHEFGHVLANAFHGNRAFEAFCEEGFSQTLANPSAALTGYALANADEWWAETFASSEVGGIVAMRSSQVRATRNLLRALHK